MSAVASEMNTSLGHSVVGWHLPYMADAIYGDHCRRTVTSTIKEGYSVVLVLCDVSVS